MTPGCGTASSTVKFEMIPITNGAVKRESLSCKSVSASLAVLGLQHVITTTIYSRCLIIMRRHLESALTTHSLSHAIHSLFSQLYSLPFSLTVSVIQSTHTVTVLKCNSLKR